MRRVVILGRGAAGKSVLAARLGQLTGLPVVALDERFWRPGLVATPPGEWAAIQRELARPDKWIMDGDLGPRSQARRGRAVSALSAERVGSAGVSCHPKG